MSQALILCAGSSSRMGQPKALCQLAGQTILGRIVATLAEVGIQSPQVIVAAPHGNAIAAWLQAQSLSSVQLRWNLHPEDGMLSSIQCGLAQLSPSHSGTLLWPVDVPLVKAQTVQRLLDAAAGTLCRGLGLAATIVATRASTEPSTPASCRRRSGNYVGLRYT